MGLAKRSDRFVVAGDERSNQCRENFADALRFLCRPPRQPRALSCASPSRESATEGSRRVQQSCANLTASKLGCGPGVSAGAGGLCTGAEKCELCVDLRFFTLSPRRRKTGVASAGRLFRGGVGTATNCRVLRVHAGKQWRFRACCEIS